MWVIRILLPPSVWSCYRFGCLHLVLALLLGPLRAQDDAFYVDVLIRNSDGSPVEEVFIARGDRYDQFTMQTAKDAHANRLRKSEDGRGNFKVLFRPDNKFVAFWNELGFAKCSVATLKERKSLQLKAWASLKLRVHTDGQQSGVPVAVSSFLTTDGLHQGFDFNLIENLAADGTVEFKRVPPGEIVIRVNYREERDEESSWRSYDRLKEMNIASGSSVSLTLGGQGTGVTGRIYANDRDFDTLHGYVESTEANEKVPLLVHQDGRFTTTTIPYGRVAIRVFDRNFRNNRRGHRLLDLQADGAEVGDMKFVGSVVMSTGQTNAAVQDPLSNAPYTVTEGNDAFRSEKNVAFVAEIQKDAEQSLVLLDETGSPIRELNGIVSPGAWAGGRSSIAADPERKRFYVLGRTADDKRASEGVLVAFNLQGTELYRFTLPSQSSAQITVDTEAGNLWLLSRRNLNETSVNVFDQDGKKLHSFLSTAFSLTYSLADKAIWLVGPNEVAKCDPASLQIAAVHPLPDGSFTLSGAVELPNGGIVAKEIYHPDMPESKNRLWMFDSDANVKATKGLGSVYPHSLYTLDSQIIVSGSEITGLRVSSAYHLFAQRYSTDFELLGESLPDVISIQAGGALDVASVLRRDGIYEMTVDNFENVHFRQIKAVTDVAWLWSVAP